MLKRAAKILTVRFFLPIALLLLVGLAQDWRHFEPILPPPAGMVLVPEGEFWMGSDHPRAEEESRPLRRVRLPAFYIDRTEVTNRQVRAVLPSHSFPAGREEHPATGLTREQAAQVLAAMGKRLPTGAEWEKAARGTDGRSYPWGEEPPEGRANVGRIGEHKCASLSLQAVGSYPNGASPYGCLDMIGNAFEWVSDDHPGPPVRHILRGGAIGYPERYCTTYAVTIEDTGVT